MGSAHRLFVLAIGLSLLTGACEPCKKKEVAQIGDCGEELLQPTAVDYGRLDLSFGCLDAGLVDLVDGLEGLEGEFRAVLGNSEYGDYRIATLVISDEEAWTTLVDENCLRLPDPPPVVDWSFQQVVVASFESTGGCDEKMNFEVLDDGEENVKVNIDFSWVAEEEVDCEPILNFALLLDTREPVNSCLTLSTGCE